MKDHLPKKVKPIFSEFMNSEITSINFCRIGPYFEITHSEMRITSTLRYFCQADRLSRFHFEKLLMPVELVSVASPTVNAVSVVVACVVSDSVVVSLVSGLVLSAKYKR